MYGKRNIACKLLIRVLGVDSDFTYWLNVIRQYNNYLTPMET